MLRAVRRLTSFLVFGSTLFMFEPKPEPLARPSPSDKEKENDDLDSEYGPEVELGDTEFGPAECPILGPDQGIGPDCGGDGGDGGDGDGDGDGDGGDGDGDGDGDGSCPA
jgi:hypothetical protein